MVKEGFSRPRGLRGVRRQSLERKEKAGIAAGP
jgi:hypothetical protein